MTYYLIIACPENDKQLVDEKELAEIQKVFKKVLKAYNSSNKGRKFELTSLQLNALKVKGSEPRSGEELHSGEDYMNFQKFMALLNDDLPNSRKVIDYSLKIGITARKLSSICHFFCGRSPKKIINEYLISESKRLLTSTGYSVKQLALQLGFSDQYQFSKYFKKHEHISPVFYRKKRSN